MKEEKEDQKKLLCPKAGTATSSPKEKWQNNQINFLNRAMASFFCKGL